MDLLSAIAQGCVMATETIKEFLVALGFKSDEAALKKFTNGIEQATKVVFGLAAAVEAGALTVAIGVEKFASNLETLYFASQRTGGSATALKAFGRAAQDFGASAEDAQGSIESLAAFMRNNPAAEGFLHGLGVGTRDAKGQMRDTVDIMGDFAKFMASKPTYLAHQYAELMGVSDKLMLAMRNPEFSKDLEKIFAELKKAGFEKAADDAHKFMMDLRRLGDQLVIFGTMVQDALQNKLKISLESITEWMQQNGPWLADQVARIASMLIDQFNAILAWSKAHWPEIKEFVKQAFDGITAAINLVKPALEWVYDQFVKLDHATDGWSTKLIALVAALRFMGLGGIVTGLGGLTMGFLGLAGGIGAAVAAGVSLGYFFDKYFKNNWLKQAGEKGAEMLDNFVHRREHAVFALTNMGWTRPQAEGIVANLNAESALMPAIEGDHGHAYGIAQWHEDRQAAFAKMYGHTMREGTGDNEKDLLEQLSFLNYEMRDGSETKAGALIRAAQTSQQAAVQMSLAYERPAGGMAEAQRRGEAALAQSNNTVIHVNGSDEPQTLARFIANEQVRVARANAAMIREFASGVE